MLAGHRRVMAVGDPAHLDPAEGERARRQARILGAHQRRADQEGVGIGRQAVDVGSARNARFGDDQRTRRHQRREPLGGREVDPQRVEIAVVDADDVGAQPDRSTHLVDAVGLDQHVHAEPARCRHHRGRFLVAEHGEDHQHRVGAVPPGFGHLARVDDEVLGEDRPEILAPHRPQIVERSAEIRRVGEHADRVRGAAIGARERSRVGAGPDRSRRGGAALHLHDEACAGPGQRRLEASPGRLGLAAEPRQPDGDVDALAGDDLGEDALSHCSPRRTA